MSTSRRKGATPKKAHKVEVSFTNWVMGGSLLSLSTTSSLGNRISSKSSHKSLDDDTDDEEPPSPTPPAPGKLTKKKTKVSPPNIKKSEEVQAVCIDCQPEPEKSAAKCAPDCPVCNEDCTWEKHMHEKYGGMECDTCGRGASWLMDEFHKGRGEYACEKCTPDCTACGRGPLWLSKKWAKTLKRRARKLQGVEKDKKDKKDDDGKQDKEGEGTKGKGKDGEKAKDNGKEKTNNKEKDKQKEKGNGGNKDEIQEKGKPEDKSAEKGKESTSKSDVVEKKNQDGKGKNTHDWTTEEDAKLKDLKSRNRSWKEIASELGINSGLCKARCKTLEESGNTATEKKNETSSGDKQNTSGGDELLGGFGDWNNNDANNHLGNSGNTDNQGWGAPDTSNTTGDHSGAADNGWGTNDNSNSKPRAEKSSWENNGSNTNADASGGDNANSSWENNNNTTTGDTGNQGWGDAGNSSWGNSNNNTNGDSGTQGWVDAGNIGAGNEDANKTCNDNSGNEANQQNQNKNNGGGKKQKNKNKDKKQDKQSDIFGPITESNPTGYIPYKSANTAADGVGSWDESGDTSFPDTTGAQASGGLANTENAQTSGSGWDAPKKDWETVDPSNENTGNEPARDPWAQPDLQNDSGNGGASNSGNNPSTSAPAGDGWFTVTESALDIPTNNNTGMSWSQLQNGGDADSWNKSGNGSQKSGNGGNSWGQGNFSSNNNDSWNKPKNASQNGGSSKGQGNNPNNAGNSCNLPNNTNQASGNGGNSWGQGNNNSNSNSNNGNNGGGFNSSNNSNGVNRGNYSRAKLHPNVVWSPEDCIRLEFLESKYREHKWVQMQADFYNWTGRMVPAEQIEQKFRTDGYA